MGEVEIDADEEGVEIGGLVSHGCWWVRVWEKFDFYLGVRLGFLCSFQSKILKAFCINLCQFPGHLHH